MALVPGFARFVNRRVTVPALSAFVAERELAGLNGPVFVQARYQGHTFCGRLDQVAWARQRDWIVVQLDYFGTVYRSPSQVVFCSGTDGRCRCAEADAEARSGRVGAAPPLGNTGVTQ